MKGADIMGMAFVDFAEKLVPVSDFSQGKAGKIFNDVAENNSEYIVLKNNQPTAVVVSVKDYIDSQKKISKLEKLLDELENIKLLHWAESRKNDNSTSFEKFVLEEGFTMDELEKMSDNVELE